MNTQTAPGALEGVTVLDISRLLPGPFCSMILADHGARVISVEDKRFQADNLFLNTIYRNKEHVSLNLKAPEGLEIFFALLERADVLLEGFRPGVVERLGVDYQSVRQKKPDIIYCSITGYGQDGPFAGRAGHDVNYLAVSGILDLMGEPDRPPSIPGVQLADIVGGSLQAVQGILLALLARQRTGQGQYIDISMTDGLLSLYPLVLHFYNQEGGKPSRGGDLLSHRYACYNTYETADGRYLAVGALENRFWKNLCTHLGLEEYIPLQYDEERREEIIARFREIFAGKTLAEWEAELEPVDGCVEAVRSLDEILQHKLFRERGAVRDFTDHRGRTVPALGLPVKMSQTPGSLRTPPVAFGQDTEAVLGELGYSAEAIDGFREAGVI
jgi:crotonobetainyl-CoA:carnitine CoA-transferase CaiB-like acyl-CoA transferase